MPKFTSLSTSGIKSQPSSAGYSYPALYSLSAVSTIVVSTNPRIIYAAVEGDTITFTLTTANVSNGTTVPYTISGVASTDIGGASLTGSFTVNNNTATLIINTTIDALVEGSEEILLELDGTNDSVSIILYDPFYFLLTDVIDYVNEGDTFTVTLATLGVPNGTSVPYTITGVTSDDINGASLTGNFVINNNEAVETFVTTVNPAVEGNETFTLTLDNGFAFVEIIIAESIYSLSTSSASADEGTTFTITLDTQFVKNDVEVPYTITGVSSADIDGADLTGVFTIVDGTDSIEFTVTRDATTEGTEIFLLSLDNGKDSQAVTINDTSLDPTYTLSRSASSAAEGSSFTITLTTTDVFDDTLVPYTITGVSSADINGVSLTGNFTITNNTASRTFSLTQDLTTEGIEVFNLALDNGADDISVAILDTSQTPTYQLQSSSNGGTVNEGDSISVTLNTTNLPEGYFVPYTVSGITNADLTTPPGITGAFQVFGNSASLTWRIKEDFTSDGTETFTLNLNNGEGGTITVTILDTSQGPTYSLSASAASVNEGGTFTVTLTTTNVPDGTVVAYTITGVTSSDIGGTSLTGNFPAIISGSTNLSFSVTRDVATEGTETFTLTCGAVAGEPSVNVTINDTSTFLQLLWTLTDPDPEGSSFSRAGITIYDGGFGYSSAIDGDLLVMGEPLADQPSSAGRGWTYLYDLTSGNSTAAIRRTEQDTANNFGFRVAINSNYVYISDPTTSLIPGVFDTGVVQVYNRSGQWQRSAFQIFDSYSPSGSLYNYGRGLAATDSWMVAGAPNARYVNNDNGTLRWWPGGWCAIRSANGQTALNNIANPDYGNSSTPLTNWYEDDFGYEIAAADPYIVVSSPFDDVLNPNDNVIYPQAGSIWAYSWNGTTLTRLWQYTDPSTIVSNRYLGSNEGLSYASSGKPLAMNSSYTILGQARYAFNGLSAGDGKVVILNNSDGSVVRTISHPNGTEDTNFGFSVAINSTYFAISAPYQVVSGRNIQGAVFLYRLSDGQLIQTFLNPLSSSLTQQESLFFGTALSMSDRYLGMGTFIGGKFYVYALAP